MFGRRLGRLEGLIPFAPRSVEAELSRLLARPRLLQPERRRIRGLLERARAVQRLHPGDGASCAFPAVARDEVVEGAVFYALAAGDRRMAACPLEVAFHGEEAMRSLLSRLSTTPLLVLPHPQRSSIPFCSLEGGSGAAAFAVAAEAARRGVSVPDDVVISAALAEGADGRLYLRPVAGCDTKRRVLERELPGCRFFFVADPEEAIGPSSSIHLFPLDPAPLEDLFDLLLPAPMPKLETLHRRIQEGEALFASQRYAASRPIWTGAREALEAWLGEAPSSELRRWHLTTLSRLGALELHEGKPEEAQRLFDQAMAFARENDGLPRLVVDEALVQAAGAAIDRNDPEAARAILDPLATMWRERLEADDEGEERRAMLIACLGGLRRLHLLCDDAEMATEVQVELLRWTGEAELARSFVDLGECLRRSGRARDASLAWARARETLPLIPLETYRTQTEAFLLYYEGRLALDQGLPLDLAACTRLAASLPEGSAAAWRLRQLQALGALREGQPEGRAELVAMAEEAQSDFARWQASLGLLRAHGLGADTLAEAARHFAELGGRSSRYPALDALRERFVTAVERGEPAATLASALLRHSAY